MFYLDLFRELDKASVEYVLVGGLAINLHGVERATMDVDLAIALTDDNIANAMSVARTLGLRPVAPVDPSSVDRAQLERWRTEKNLVAFGMRSISGHTPTVDFLVASPIPYATLAQNAVARQIEGIAVRIASIEDLIAMKRHTGRSIDLSDADALERILAGRTAQ